jgi:Tol biopolymer transport system component
MATPESPVPSGSGRRLPSWKEIAGHLERDVRTVQRWEKSEGLPVQRHVHDSRASVYAYTGELDAWLANRRQQLPAEPAAPVWWKRRRAWALGGAAAVLFAALSYLAINHSSEPEGVELLPIFRGQDIDGAGAPSWDGRFVPYRTNKAEMRVYDRTTGQSRVVLSHPPTEQQNFEIFMILSPDGQRLVYSLGSLQGPAQVRILDTRTSADRLLFKNPKFRNANPRSWSTDGRQVAVALVEEDGTRNIAVIDTINGSSRILYRAKDVTNALISPDGRLIAYNQSGDIHAVPVAGGAPIEAVVHPARDMLVGWAPDGRLVFTSDRSGTRDMYTVRLKDSGPAGPPELIRQDTNISLPLGITRQGELIFARNSPLVEIYNADLDAAGDVVSGPTPLAKTRFVGQNRMPDYSRDGRFLAYLSGPQDAQDRAIRIRDLSSGQEREFPAPAGNVQMLRWYPDGTALLLHASGPGLKLGFYRLSLDPGAGPQERLKPVLTKGVPGHLSVNPMFSPDGRYLYYEAQPSPEVQVLMRLDLSSGALKEVFRPKGEFLRMYSLSPDGLQIAYSSRRNQPEGGTRDYLYVEPLSGGSPRQLDDADWVRASGGLAWAADGKAILYHHPDPRGITRDELLRVPMDGGPPERLFTTDTIVRIAAAPGGRRITWQGSGTFWEVSALENAFAKARMAGP